MRVVVADEVGKGDEILFGHHGYWSFLSWFRRASHALVKQSSHSLIRTSQPHLTRTPRPAIFLEPFSSSSS
jgi:hypothetical protein